ncbi:hypothetical protein [Parvularcula oceani]|uniref:hypothetical protein n=1 Tax=Parvularcula oceani TaxID=1247963 RepID=UPI0012DCBA9F|nr:hypothetical protein [Parvularcula oceani]
MDREEWYRTRHDRELDRRAALIRGASVPAGIAGGFGAAAYNALVGISWPLNFFDWAKVYPIVVAASYLGRGYFRLARVFTVWGLHYPAVPKLFKDYYDKRLAYHKGKDDADPSAKATEDWNHILVDDLIECASDNFRENGELSEELNRAKVDVVATGWWLSAVYGIIVIEKIFTG